MKKLFVGLVSLCCAFSAVIANDQQIRIYELDTFDQTISSLLFEPLVPTSKAEPAIEEHAEVISAVSVPVINFRDTEQIFQNDIAPFTPLVRKAMIQGPPVIFDKLNSLERFRQLNQAYGFRL